MLIVIIFALAFFFTIVDLILAWVENKKKSTILNFFLFILSVCLNCFAIGYFDATVVEVIIAIVLSYTVTKTFLKKKTPTAAPAHA